MIRFLSSLLLLIVPISLFARRGSDEWQSSPSSPLIWIVLGAIIIGIILIREQISTKESKKKAAVNKEQLRLEQRAKDRKIREKKAEIERIERAKELKIVDKQRERQLEKSVPLLMIMSFMKSVFYEYEVDHPSAQINERFQTYEDALKCFEEIVITKGGRKAINGISKTKSSSTILLGYIWTDDLDTTGFEKIIKSELLNTFEDNFKNIEFTIEFVAKGKKITKTGVVPKEIYLERYPVIYHDHTADLPYLLDTTLIFFKPKNQVV